MDVCSILTRLNSPEFYEIGHTEVGQAAETDAIQKLEGRSSKYNCSQTPSCTFHMDRAF